MIGLDTIIIGAVKGAMQAVIPPVVTQVEKTIDAASASEPHEPTPPVPAALDPDILTAKVIDAVMKNPAIAQRTQEVEWYKSQAIWGGILATAAPIVALIGYNVSPADQAQLAVAIPTAIGGVAGLIAIIGRLTTTRTIKGTTQ